MARTDTERLNWLEKRDGSGLISDDAGRWAVSGTGEQPVPNFDSPIEMWTTFYVEAHEWRNSVREAIDAGMDAESEARDDR